MTRIDRAALRQKIQGLGGLTDDERAALPELAATKRYELVWENHAEEAEERLREQLPVLIKDPALRIEAQAGEDARAPIKVYVFSPGAYAWDDDFHPVLDRVELCVLPEAIYQAYRNVLPKKMPKKASESGNVPLSEVVFNAN